MLSVAKLSPGQEAYYERSVAAGIDAYYAGEGESPGVWTGAGAAVLELEGVVGEGELGRLISGRHPVSAAVLRSHPPKRQISVERIDPLTGERYLAVKTLAPVAGYDLVFSPPKSVSLLHALGGPDVRHAVDQAHLAAWQAALAYLEREACVTRRGKNGVLREQGSGFVAAAYQHRTSRAQDPHLHTHVIVANMTHCPDGEWRALDGEALLKTYRLAAGYLYQSQLRFELTRTLGVEWRQPEHGMADVDGVPEQALRAFSQRRAAIVDYLDRHGSSGFYAAKVAAVETRDRKEPIDLPRLREEWRARAAEHGLGRRELQGLLGRVAYRELDERSVQDIAEELLGPSGLTENRTRFSPTEAVRGWAESHRQGAPAERILALTDRFLASTRIAPLGAPAVGRPAVFSTSELLQHERAALELIDRGQGTNPATVSAPTLERVAREGAGTLSAGQTALLRSVCSSKDRVVCVVGRAGAGKTTALAAVAEAFRRDGFVAIGAAPSGIAAEKLAAEANLPTGTLHRLLVEANRSGGLPRGCVLIVDEAGMADTRTLTRVLGQVERAGGKAVLVGDPAQLPSVGAGGLFAAIVDRHGAVELTENRRQRDLDERRALAALRNGESNRYLAHAAAHGRLAVADDLIDAKARLVADWWRAARPAVAGNAMIAYRRRDVADLNAAAHTLMDQDGQLGHERLLLYTGIELAAGDRIVCTRNDRSAGVANGTLGTITRLDAAARSLTLANDEGCQITLPAAYLDSGHVQHAYALTGHKTQGLTLERAFVLAAGEGNVKEWGYVALSRARQETRLYTTTAEVEPDTPPTYRPEPADPVEQLAAALTRQAAETTAFEQQAQALVQRSRALETRRTQVARDLRRANQELTGSGLLGRVRRGPQLRDQIAEQRATLTRIDEELRTLNRELRTIRREVFLSAPKRDRHRELTRPRSPERDLGRERSVDRGIER